MNNKIDLSIIVLSYNTTDLLKDCLDSLDKVKGEVNYEIVVVDNDSTDGSPEMLQSEYPGVILIQKNKNVGFAAGNNSAKKAINKLRRKITHLPYTYKSVISDEIDNAISNDQSIILEIWSSDADHIKNLYTDRKTGAGNYIT